MNTETLVQLAEIYASYRRVTLSTISTYAATDGKFFGRLKDGAGCTLRKAALVLSWFSDNWPEDLEWPAEIARPPKSRRESA
ncbi:MAG: hypothetical protein ACK4TJ_05390 [Tabrizicola sp.]